MKTGPDLPEELVKEVKLQAVREGRTLKDVVADLVRRELDSTPVSPRRFAAMVGKDELTGRLR